MADPAGMRTLTLVSPMMRGKDVITAQRKLIRGKFLRAGQADGVYGPETSRASARAHWELGFPPALAQSTAYGAGLDRTLTRWLADEELPDAYAKRRKARLAQHGKVGVDALNWLRGHVGETESPPGSNRVSWASTWYGIIGPWCAMGVTRSRVEAGSKVFIRGRYYAYVPYIVADATYARRGLRKTFRPQRGDLVCFDYDGGGIFDHVETVDTPPNAVTHGAAFSTIGCNTSFDAGGSQSNGGACAHRNRTVVGGGRTVFIREIG
jgi:peptidoglycan hydrolase-like protein with peptidoglycan-binding domain